MRSLKTESENNQKILRGHLRRIKKQHRLYNKEIALLMDMSSAQGDYVRKMMNNQAEIHMVDVIALSRNLITEYGDGSLLMEMVPDGYTAQIVQTKECNGSVIDEITEITKLSGMIIEAAQMKHVDGSLIVDLARKIATESGTIEKEMG